MKINLKQKSFKKKTRVCVYCGSRSGKGSRYIQLAQELGSLLALQSCDLVYGGGNVGLMGEVSRSVMKSGAKVFGVIPEGLFGKEVASTDISKLYVVKNMHQRKAKMEKLADAFLAIPGGYGTLDELFEIITWNQIGIHQKPVFILNINGFYQPMIDQIKLMTREGFISKEHLARLIVCKNLQDFKKKLNQHVGC